MVVNHTAKARSRMVGFTVIELMVVIAIVAIASAVAIPDLSSWVVNSRIREAAGHIEESMQWARAYALKTDQPVYFQTGYTSNPHGGTACWWTGYVNESGTTSNNWVPLNNAPDMTALLFRHRYPGVSCQYVKLQFLNGSVPPTLGATYYLEFYPDGTILDSSSGVYGSFTLAEGGLLLNARMDAPKYAQWLSLYYGAGELRSCVTQSAGPPYSCVLS